MYLCTTLYSHLFRCILMRYLFLLLIVFFAGESRASHVMGGEITWRCQGGNYVFELVFYRDCNGAEVNTVSETIQVWNHPSLSTIQVAFVSRTDISPFCNPVGGSPARLTCGNGASGGNGIGAIEKITYRSSPIAIAGIPPAAGWIFTAQNFSRSNAITNLTDPGNYGITISAHMFAIPGGAAGCVDSSPRFLQEPYLVSCAGTPYVYNMNAVDPDLDSIVVSFGSPLNNFTTGVFNPPTNPIEVPFETGFNTNSPTPDNTFDPGNIAASVNSSSGELSFTSFTTGNFVVKLVAKSYRQGVLIAQVEREMQLVVMNCLPANTPPVIAGPFGGLFETTIFAGDLVNFNLTSTDVEFLQDGTPQNNILTASGLMFGTNFISNTGCGIVPCASLNNAPAITGVQGVTAAFNWQTSCDHLVNQYGIVAEEVPYHFVFKVQDNYCQVPKVTYATVTIHVKNPGIIKAPKIDCIQTAANGQITIRWTSVQNPGNSFVQYRIRTASSATPLTTITNINTNSYSYTPPAPGIEEYYIEVVSGCNGNTTLAGERASNIRLTLLNPSNGTAVLQWNEPVTPYNASLNGYYHVMREYPAGNWTLIDSVPYGTQMYLDTIDICQAFLNYQVVLPTDKCSFTSNIEGDNFEDMMTPEIPVVQSVTIDTLTGSVTVTWNVNGQPDTYGYVVYMADPDGILFELDTVWGVNNVSYTFDPDTENGPLTFSVSAFDSCFTPAIPPTYQTSAKGEIHTTAFVDYSYNVCAQIATLTWSPYIGWNDLAGYEVYGRLIGGPWTLFGTSTQTSFQIPVTGLVVYEFAIRAFSTSGKQSFSNKIKVSAIAPSEPAFHYTRVATVTNKYVQIKHYIDLVGGVSKLQLERKNEHGVFVAIQKVDATSSNIEFTDSEVATDRKSYTYRVRIIDSCGNEGAVANEVKTILLKVQPDDIRMKNYVSWSAYQGFNGSIIHYNVYRGIDGVYTWLPTATVPSHTLYFEDDLSNLTDLNGKICYYVEAIESMNVYAFSEISRSNEVCAIFEPLIYIPNAFTPGGVNPVFKPIVSLIDPLDYNLSIVDRWGQVMFHTTDMNEGWDGTITLSDKVAPTGTYMYVLRVKDGSGEEITKRGHVTLLK